MIIFFLIVGAILGGIFLEEGGILPGALLGYLLYRDGESRKRIGGLRDQMDVLKERIRRLTETPQAPADTLASDAATPDVVPEPEPIRIETPEPVRTEEPEPTTAPEKTAKPAPVLPPPPRREPVDDVLEQWYYRLKDFVFGGNLLARIAVAILFVGVSFSIQLLIERNVFPIELRLAGAGLLGVAMIAFGWRVAGNRKGYGVTLQGGGIAIIFLTVFASYRLYELLPSQAAFFILIAVTLLGAFIAVRQNAQSLAVLSMLGGFLAPIITSTDSGNHVALFSYYIVLNAGILYMSWNKPWRFLHLTGFVFTFGIATIWGEGAYAPELFATTEPFLAAFFLMYVAMGLLYSIRHASTTNRYLDGTLVFGLPVVVFTLQAALVSHFEFGLAWSSLTMGGFYALLAWAIFRRAPEKWRLMIESYSGIGLALISMTIPFALNATWTGTGWALEAAALIWLGIRQKRPLLRAGGMLLLVAASGSFLHGFVNTPHAIGSAYKMVANPVFMGFLTLSAASIFSAFQIYKHRERLRFFWEPAAGVVFMIAGIAWWFFGGIIEIERGVASRHAIHVMIGFVSLSALAIAWTGNRLSWPAFVRGALYLPFVLYWFLLLSGIDNAHVFANRGFLAWGIALPALYYVLYLQEGHLSGRPTTIVHAVSFWLTTIIALSECHWLFDRWAPEGSVWPVIGTFIAPLGMVLGLVYLSNRPAWPFAAHRSAYLKITAVPILVGLFLGSVYMSFEIAGDPAPLPYLPLLNPIDVVLGFLALASVYWYRTLSRHQPGFFPPVARNALIWAVVGAAFVWMNAAIGRSVHHWTGAAFGDGLFEVSAFQTAMSVCWTLLAVTVMAVAARREARAPWLAAAGLLGVVVFKLFTIDLSSLTALHRVISFIAVGLLLLVIGYVAPAPPRKNDESEGSEKGDEREESERGNQS